MSSLGRLGALGSSGGKSDLRPSRLRGLMPPLRPTDHLRPHLSWRKRKGEGAALVADSELVWREGSSPPRPQPCLPRFVRSVYRREKAKGCVSSSSGSHRRAFPGETEGTWEAGGRGGSSRDRRCQGNVTGGNTFAQNENGEREQFSNLQAIRKKASREMKKMTLSGMFFQSEQEAHTSLP